MNRNIFRTYSIPQKLKVLHRYGQMKHHRIKGRFVIVLYQMNDFYIEVWSDSHKNRLCNVVTFPDRTLLNYQFNLAEVN